MKKVLITILIIVAILIVIAAVFICSQKEKLASMAMEKTMTAAKSAMMQNMPESVPADSAAKIIDAVTAKIKNGELGQEDLQVLATDFQAAFQDQKIDSTEVVMLLNTMNQLAQPAGETVAEPEPEEEMADPEPGM